MAYCEVPRNTSGLTNPLRRQLTETPPALCLVVSSVDNSSRWGSCQVSFDCLHLTAGGHGTQGVGQGPKKNARLWTFAYFLIALVLAAFFYLNLFVGLVVEVRPAANPNPPPALSVVTQRDTSVTQRAAPVVGFAPLARSSDQCSRVGRTVLMADHLLVSLPRKCSYGGYLDTTAISSAH